MRFLQKLSWLLHRRRREEELRAELEFHLEEEAEERCSKGLSPEQARWAAHRELGNVTLVGERMRAVWIWTSLEKLLQDLRYAWRMLSANKTFSALAILSLALGIGANTALYSFMDSILLRSLPVADPDSLVILQWRAPLRDGERWRSSVIHGISGTTYDDAKTGETGGIFPYPAFQLLQKNDRLFADIFAYYPARNLNLQIMEQAEVVKGEYVSGDYFGGLGVQPFAGRMIVAHDDDGGAPPAVVVSFGFAHRYFGETTKVVGHRVLINNRSWTVVGVTPPGFFGVDPGASPDIYLPLHASIALDAANPFGIRAQDFLDQNDYWIEVMARLRPGVTREQAQAALRPQFHQWAESTVRKERERNSLPTLMVEKGATGVETLRRRYSKPLYFLIALAGLILTIACANVANLLLARAAARRSEMALRLSLGAGRLRLVRQLLTESTLLASLGGILGVLVAIWGMRFLTAMLSRGQADFTLHAELNWHVLGVNLGLCLLTGVLFGLAPAMQSTRPEVLPALKQVRASEAHPRMRPRLSRLLVISQIALSLIMLLAAGLFARTLKNLHAVELGFNSENLLLFDLDARNAGHNDPEISVFYGDLLERFAAIPGVVHASVSDDSLIRAGSGLDIHLPGAPDDPATRYLLTGPGFFKTMQIPILAGREIGEQDQPNSPKVAVISELFARVNFGDQNPVGRHIILENDDVKRDMEIVGVAKEAHYGPLHRRVPPVVYMPYNQGYPPPRSMTYALRTTRSGLAVANTVREMVHQADPRVPVTDVRTEVADIDRNISQEITFAKLCTGFAVLALVIACVGLYATVSYNVARRIGEIGIRMALGAQRGSVLWMILREVVIMAAAGLAISVPLALSAAGLIQSFLFGMKANDPVSLAVAVATLVTAAVIAGYVPARKASRIDPMTALRYE